jgi:SpoVK/Ycf46/Vps4 family AAA+-type ATPase
MSPKEEITLLVKSREPIIYIVSHEERRVQALIEEIADVPVVLDKTTVCQRSLYTWDCTAGLRVRASDNDTNSAKAAKPAHFRKYTSVAAFPDQPEEVDFRIDPLSALEYVLRDDQAAIYVFNWLHHYVKDMKDINVMRMLARLAAALRASLKTLIILSPVLELPPELERLITVYDFPLPEDPELTALTERRVESLKLKTGPLTLDDEQKRKMVTAAKGLTLDEADRAISKWMVYHGGQIQNADTSRIFLEKAQLIRKSGFFEIIETTASVDSFGGYDILKSTLSEISVRFTDEARAYPLPYPKGFVLVGPPGVGKTYCAKVIAGFVGFLLLRMDMGSFFGPLLGQSESQFNHGLKQVEACAPCVLLCDEYEKTFVKSASHDSASTPTEGRVTAKWLYWLQECQKPIFRIASINHPERVDPEHLRQGRWDEIIFLDLPNTEERAQIFAIHLRKRNRDPVHFDVGALAKESKGFTGSEIEQSVIRGMTIAFRERREVQTEDICYAIKATTPQSVARAEDIEKIRKWAVTAQAVRASAPETDSQALIRQRLDDVGVEI